jgi:hypothetical protein
MRGAVRYVWIGLFVCLLISSTASAKEQEFRAKWLTDIEASFRAADYVFAAGVQNLFNVFPDRNTTVNSFNGIQTFPSHSPFGMNGRGLYARIGRTF